MAMVKFQKGKTDQVIKVCCSALMRPYTRGTSSSMTFITRVKQIEYTDRDESALIQNFVIIGYHSHITDPDRSLVNWKLTICLRIRVLNIDKD